MSSVTMPADSTQSELKDGSKSSRNKKKDKNSSEKKKKKESKSKKVSRKKRDQDSAASDCDSDLDLSKELKPISAYIRDRETMTKHLFRSISGQKMKAMLPEVLKVIPLEELKRLCLEQLECMSHKRIKRILQGIDPEAISSSGTDDDDVSSEEEKASGGRSGDDSKSDQAADSTCNNSDNELHTDNEDNVEARGQRTRSVTPSGRSAGSRTPLSARSRSPSGSWAGEYAYSGSGSRRTSASDLYRGSSVASSSSEQDDDDIEYVEEVIVEEIYLDEGEDLEEVLRRRGTSGFSVEEEIIEEEEEEEEKEEKCPGENQGIETEMETDDNANPQGNLDQEGTENPDRMDHVEGEEVVRVDSESPAAASPRADDVEQKDAIADDEVSSTSSADAIPQVPEGTGNDGRQVVSKDEQDPPTTAETEETETDDVEMTDSQNVAAGAAEDVRKVVLQDSEGSEVSGPSNVDEARNVVSRDEEQIAEDVREELTEVLAEEVTKEVTEELTEELTEKSEGGEELMETDTAKPDEKVQSDSNIVVAREDATMEIAPGDEGDAVESVVEVSDMDAAISEHKQDSRDEREEKSEGIPTEESAEKAEQNPEGQQEQGEELEEGEIEDSSSDEMPVEEAHSEPEEIIDFPKTKKLKTKKKKPRKVKIIKRIIKVVRRKAPAAGGTRGGSTSEVDLQSSSKGEIVSDAKKVTMIVSATGAGKGQKTAKNPDHSSTKSKPSTSKEGRETSSAKGSQVKKVREYSTKAEGASQGGEPSSDISGKLDKMESSQEKALNKMEILELEMRARAIKAMLRKHDLGAEKDTKPKRIKLKRN